MAEIARRLGVVASAVVMMVRRRNQKAVDNCDICW
jgi:hypothetical protein